MRPINFTAIITRLKKATHYTLSAITILFALGAIACTATLTLTSMQTAAIEAAVICTLGLITTIIIGNKLQQNGILEDPSNY